MKYFIEVKKDTCKFPIYKSMKGMTKGFNVKNRLSIGNIFNNNASKQIEKG